MCGSVSDPRCWWTVQRLAAGGIWETRDAGANWVARRDAQSSLSIGALSFAPSSCSIVYAGTGEANFAQDGYSGVGVLKSTHVYSPRNRPTISLWTSQLDITRVGCIVISGLPAGLGSHLFYVAQVSDHESAQRTILAPLLRPSLACVEACSRPTRTLRPGLLEASRTLRYSGTARQVALPLRYTGGTFMSEGAAARSQLAPSPGRLAQRHLTGVHQAALIVDDDGPMRLAVERLLSGAGVATLAADTGDAALAVLEAQADEVGVVISDFAMPGMDGAELLSIIRRRWPRIRRVLLTGTADMAGAARAVNEGQVSRLFLKPYTPVELLDCIHELLEADTPAASPIGDGGGIEHLTAREREVLAWLGSGASNAEIAVALHLTQGSARIYVKRVLAKLGVGDRTKAALHARAIGLEVPRARDGQG